MQAYEIAIGIALTIIGAFVVCVALILRFRETEPLDHPHDADAGDSGEFADSLQRTDEANANELSCSFPPRPSASSRTA